MELWFDFYKSLPMEFEKNDVNLWFDFYKSLPMEFEKNDRFFIKVCPWNLKKMMWIYDVNLIGRLFLVI